MPEPYERWFQERAAREDRSKQGSGYVLPLKENGQRVSYPFGIIILAVTLDGVRYEPPYPILLQPTVTYIAEIVDGRVSFDVDISLTSNWNEVPAPPR